MSVKLSRFIGVLLLFAGGPSCALGGEHILSPFARQHLTNALYCMNMSERDLAFDKDHGEPVWALKGVQQLLAQPLTLPALGDACVEALADEGGRSTWSLLGRLLETEVQQVIPARPEQLMPMPWDWLSPDLAKALTEFMLAVDTANGLLVDAFSALDAAARQHAAAYFLADILGAELDEAGRRALVNQGIPEDRLAAVLEEANELDPEPAAVRFLASVEAIKWPRLLEAASVFQRAVAELEAAVDGVKDWPDEVVRLATEHGSVIIGSGHQDAFAERALLILDPGGNDHYEGAAGAANGLLGSAFAAIVDLEGHDRYASSELLGAGAALFGVSVLSDRSGQDVYRAAHLGQGSALFGCGWHCDQAGSDVYEAGRLAQGSGAIGVGLLYDADGDDRYEVGLLGQGFAGVRGVGILHDRAGNDVYRAGGQQADYGRHDAHYLSMAQGMSLGMRPFAGGGYGILLDRGGNDAYRADVYGQGVGYWYAVGMLLDADGNDTYRVYHYGQGSGIHLSLGLLSDGGGQDAYDGEILAQGNAHDYAVGMLIDRGGNDTYRAGHDAQGRGMNNGLALLADYSGNDAYYARDPEQAQGVGNDGGQREYGSLAILMDLQGADRYSCGAEDGARLLRPNFGIVYDLMEEEDAARP